MAAYILSSFPVRYPRDDPMAGGLGDAADNAPHGCKQCDNVGRSRSTCDEIGYVHSTCDLPPEFNFLFTSPMDFKIACTNRYAVKL